MSSETQAASSGQERDSEDLARFGYSQELKRSLGLFSSFAVAFSYISPSTGIFTLFALGLTTLGGVFIWTWPVVALGDLLPDRRADQEVRAGRGAGRGRRAAGGIGSRAVGMTALPA